MAKQAVAVRLQPETIARADAYAAARKVSRQVVLESGIESFLDDAKRGVPDLVPEPPMSKSKLERAAEAARVAEEKAVAAMQAAHGARQAKLNAAKYGSR